MELSQDMGQLEVSQFAFQHALSALQALARGDARVLFNDDDEPIGVAWPYEGCEEEIRWEN